MTGHADRVKQQRRKKVRLFRRGEHADEQAQAHAAHDSHGKGRSERLQKLLAYHRNVPLARQAWPGRRGCLAWTCPLQRGGGVW